MPNVTFSVPSYIITCHNCGHGTDLRGCPQSPLCPEGTVRVCLSVCVWAGMGMHMYRSTVLVNAEVLPGSWSPRHPN